MGLVEFQTDPEPNATVVFKKQEKKVGDYVNVKIQDCTSATLIGEII